MSPPPAGDPMAKVFVPKLPGERLLEDVPRGTMGEPVGQGADEDPDVTAEKEAEAKEIAAMLARKVKVSNPPAEPITRLFLAGKPIATPGNLVTIISKAKTGKTAALGGAVAAIIAASLNRTDLDTLGFTASNPDNKAVVVIDTEQSPFDAWTCYQRSLKRAETETDPEWLHHYALVGYSVPQLKRALALSAKIIVNPVATPETTPSTQSKGIFCIILDGVADFVLSVNDEAESSEFISELRALSVQYDCPIICVIHSNEAVKAGDDGRGHLGKQLTRKAESNLLLKKVGDVTVITSEKQRKAPITEDDGIAFKWSDAEQRHVTCQSGASAKDEAKRDRLREIADAVFEHMGKRMARYGEIVKAIGEVRKIGPSGAEDRFSDMKKLGVIVKDLMGFWSLKP